MIGEIISGSEDGGPVFFNPRYSLKEILGQPCVRLMLSATSTYFFTQMSVRNYTACGKQPVNPRSTLFNFVCCKLRFDFWIGQVVLKKKILILLYFISRRPQTDSRIFSDISSGKNKFVRERKTEIQMLMNKQI